MGGAKGYGEGAWPGEGGGCGEKQFAVCALKNA